MRKHPFKIGVREGGSNIPAIMNEARLLCVEKEDNEIV